MKKNIPVIMAHTLLKTSKIGEVKKKVRDTLNNKRHREVIIDLTDVEAYSTNERKLTLMAEALQDLGVEIIRLTDNNEAKDNNLEYSETQKKLTNPFSITRTTRRIIDNIERRTVRVAFGKTLTRALYDAPSKTDIRKMLDNPEDGEVKAIRFRTEAEAKAYRLGLSDMMGYEEYINLNGNYGDFPDVSKSIPTQEF